jgi:hypothetical protein
LLIWERRRASVESYLLKTAARRELLMCNPPFFLKAPLYICEQELLLSYARLDADFGTDNFARNDDFEAAVFLAAAAV